MDCHDRLPMHPGDLDPDASWPALLDAYQRHVLALAACRAGTLTGSAEPGRRAVAALSIGHALAADLAEERWPIVRDALAHGVSCAQLGRATGGLEPDELAAGLTAWADRQRATGTLSDARYAAALALVEACLPRQRIPP